MRSLTDGVTTKPQEVTTRKTKNAENTAFVEILLNNILFDSDTGYSVLLVKSRVPGTRVTKTRGASNQQRKGDLEWRLPIRSSQHPTRVLFFIFLWYNIQELKKTPPESAGGRAIGATDREICLRLFLLRKRGTDGFKN